MAIALGTARVKTSPGVTAKPVMDRILRVNTGDWRVVTNVRSRAGQPRVHVVIGPAGVFAVTAEHHVGDVRVVENRVSLNGAPSDMLQHAMVAAEGVAGGLGRILGDAAPEVVPVLLLDGCSLRIKADPTRVRILRSRQVPGWFRRQRKGDLSLSQRDRIEAAIRSPRTWET